MADLSRLKAASERLEEAEKAAEQALLERNQAIAEALDSGARILEVQMVTGLSGARVSQIRSRLKAKP